MAKTDYKTIDQYHKAFSGEVLARMERIRKIIKEVAPDAEDASAIRYPVLNIAAI